MRALEEERNKEDKRRNQERTRAELDMSLRLKMKRKAREMQEELAMDMKLLQEILQKTSDEDLHRHQRKVNYSTKKLRKIFHVIFGRMS